VPLELLLALERGEMQAALLDHPLDERPDVVELRVRLVRGEVAHGCNPMRAVNLDAVTIDAFGTLVGLDDPLPALRASLAERGVDRDLEEVRRGFEAEVAHYVPRSHEGRDEATLALLRRDCAEVFLAAAGAAELDPDTFPFVAAIRFHLLPGARDACTTLLGAGLRVAVVSNWDVGLRAYLEELGLDLPVFTSAQAGAPKPAPAAFALALAHLGVEPARATHIGDSAADRDGAAAAGMRFEPAPLADAVARILA
jgi:FMN phosphatase YigB (HAD superfamily)